MNEVAQQIAGFLLVGGFLLLLPEVIVMNRLWQPGLAIGIPVLKVILVRHLPSLASLPSGEFRVDQIDCRRNPVNSIGINTLPTYGSEEWRMAIPLKTWIAIQRDGAVLWGRLPVSLSAIFVGFVLHLWSSYEAPLIAVAAAAVLLTLIYIGVRQSRWSGEKVLGFLLESDKNA
jgi:hypothetical protein